MPRKYRPPASARRRKSKPADYDFTAPEETGVETAVAEDGVDADAEEGAEDGAALETGGKPSRRASRNLGERPDRHVGRDYSYVRTELVRIAVIGGVIIVALIIGGFFR